MPSFIVTLFIQENQRYELSMFVVCKDEIELFEKARPLILYIHGNFISSGDSCIHAHESVQISF